MQSGDIIVFSGAGISAESNLATFRDSNGLWANYDPMEVCNYLNWRENYKLVHEFYNKRREELGSVKPNIAHKNIKKLSEKYNVINITQNVDNLFERAGCNDVIHLHGNLCELICLKCGEIINLGYESYDFTPCPKCGFEMLKPNIVFFFEPAPKYATMYQIFENVKDNDIIIVIGTSGEVVNICSMLNKGYKILNNLDSSPNINEAIFDSVYLEKSSTASAKIYKEIEKLKA